MPEHASCNCAGGAACTAIFPELDQGLLRARAGIECGGLNGARQQLAPDLQTWSQI